MKDSSRKLMLAGRVALGVVLLYLVARNAGGWKETFRFLAMPILLLPVVAFSPIGAYVEALRLVPLLRSQGVSIPLGGAFRLVTAAFAFNFVIPGGASGDLSKLVYLRSARGDKSWELAAIVFVDRLVGLSSMLLLTVILGAFGWSFVRRSPILVTLLAIAIALLASIAVFTCICLARNPAPRALAHRALRFVPFRRYLSRVADACFAFSAHRGALAQAFLTSLAGNIAGALVFTLLGWALFTQLAFPAPALLSMLGMFANTFTLTPGGLGVGEAAFEGLFGEAGVRGGAALMILWRVGMLPLCILGLVFYLRGLSFSGTRAGAPRIDPTHGPTR